MERQTARDKMSPCCSTQQNTDRSPARVYFAMSTALIQLLSAFRW